MFTWIEKVIPQPPETPRKSPADGPECAAPPIVATAKCDEQTPCVATNPAADANMPESSAAADASSGGVLSWLAQGLGKVVPQPADSPTLARAQKEAPQPVLAEVPKPVTETVEKAAEAGGSEHADSSSRGVLSWLSHGLEKVVPQPVWTYRASVSGGPEQSAAAEQKPQAEEKMEKVEEMNIPPVSPVHSPVLPPVAAVAPAEIPPAPAVEVEASAPEKGSGSGVLNWLRQGLGKVVPQPETPMAPQTVEEEKPKEEEPPTPPAPRKDSKSSTESTGVLSWITQGLEKVIPQPVSAKQDSQSVTLCPVEEFCIPPTRATEGDLCVEDLEAVTEEAAATPGPEEDVPAIVELAEGSLLTEEMEAHLDTQAAPDMTTEEDIACPVSSLLSTEEPEEPRGIRGEAIESENERLSWILEEDEEESELQVSCGHSDSEEETKVTHQVMLECLPEQLDSSVLPPDTSQYIQALDQAADIFAVEEIEKMAFVHPAVSIEDVDSGSITEALGQEESVKPPASPYRHRTLTVPGTSALSKSRKRTQAQGDDMDEFSDAAPEDEEPIERSASAVSHSSTIITERLQELVRLFKDRTERVKERLLDPEMSSEDESPSGCE